MAVDSLKSNAVSNREDLRYLQRLSYSLIGKYHIQTWYKQISVFKLDSIAEETSLSLAL